VGTELFLGQADGFDQIIHCLEFERRQIELTANPLNHFRVFRIGSVHVAFNILLLVAFQSQDSLEAHEFKRGSR